MGERVAETSAVNIEAVTDQAAKGISGNPNPTEAEKGTAAGTADRGRTDRGRTDEAEKKSTSLSMVDADEEAKREERNAKRRARYAEQKANGGGTVKPRKVNKNTAKKELDSFTNKQLIALLVSVSAIAASRPNNGHWMLTDAEAETIVTPLCNIMNKYEAFNKVSENGNEIALAVACISVFAPRVMISVAQAKAAKPKENLPIEGVKKHDKVGEKKASDLSVDRRNDKGTSTNHPKPIDDLPTWLVSGY